MHHAEYKKFWPDLRQRTGQRMTENDNEKMVHVCVSVRMSELITVPGYTSGQVCWLRSLA